MKNILIILFLFISIGINAQRLGRYPIQRAYSAESPAPAGDIAIVHYLFNNSGTDESGNGYDATLTGMKYDAVSPAEGSHSGDFDGTFPQFTIPSAVVLGDTFSVSCHIRIYSGGNYNEILSPYKVADWEKWRWWMDGNLFDIEFRGYQDGTNTLDQAGTTNSFWTNGSSWMHMVLIYENGTVTIYKDGVTSMANSTTWTTSDMTLNATPFNIGRYLNGDMDDFSLYDYALSIANITKLGTPGAVLTEADRP